METVNVLDGIKPDGKVLINSATPLELEGHETFNIDLTKIALSLEMTLAGNPILNTPLLGALAKFDLVSRESVRKVIAETFKDERNVTAAMQAFEELKI